MGIAEIKLPDGRTAEIKYPDGASREDVINHVMSKFGGATQAQQPQELEPTQPQNDIEAQAQTLAKNSPYIPILSDLTQPMKDLGTGAVQGIAHGVSALTGWDTPKNWADKQSEIQRRAYEIQRGESPLPESVSKGAEFVGNFVAPSGVGAVGQGIKGAIATGAIGGALGGALEPVYGNDAKNNFAQKKLEQVGYGTALGGALGGAIGGIGKGAEKVIDTLIPTIEKDTAQLAKRAKDFGIHLRLDQLSPTRARNTVQKISQEIPFSDVDNFENVQRKRWNTAVAKTLDKDLKDVSPSSLNKFIDKIGKTYDSILKNKNITIKTDDIKNIDSQLNHLSEKLGPSSLSKAKSIYSSMTGAIDGKALRKGEQIETIKSSILDEYGTPFSKEVKSGKTIEVFKAQKLASMRSELIKKQAEAQGDSKIAISDLIEKIDGIFDKNLGQETKNALKATNKRYRNYKIIEKALRGSTDGEINPTKLLNAIESNKYINDKKIGLGEDDIVDLARIGKQFLPKKGGSDTFQKSAYTIGAGGVVSGATDLVTGGLATGGTIAGNRAYQKLYNQSKKNVSKSIEKSLGGNVDNVDLSGAILPISGGASRLVNQDKQQQFTQDPTQEYDEEFNQILQEYNSRNNQNADDEFQSILDEYNGRQSSNDSFVEKVKMAESGGNPNAQSKTSSAKGLFGFTDSTWQSAVNKWGREFGVKLSDRNNLEAQTAMFLKLTEDNSRRAESTLGRSIDDGDRYVLHFMGVGAGTKLLRLADKNPNALAKNIFPKEAQSNKSIFYSKSKPRTLAEVAEILKNKVA